jgi:hypothetical protein
VRIWLSQHILQSFEKQLLWKVIIKIIVYRIIRNFLKPFIFSVAISPLFKKRKENVKPRQLRNRFSYHFTNAIEEETREKCDSEFQLNSPFSSGDEFLKESGFMGDDEEDLSSDDSNNEVEFFPVHQAERDDRYQHSTICDVTI